MELFNKLKDAIVGGVDVTETRITTMTKEHALKSIASKTCLGDLMQNPEKYKAEIYFEGKGIVAKVIPKERDEVITI